MSESTLEHIKVLGEESRAAHDALEQALRAAVEAGYSFTALGNALGQSNSAVRIKAQRKGWDVSGQAKPRR